MSFDLFSSFLGWVFPLSRYNDMNGILFAFRGSPNIEMDEHTFMVNRERAVDYLNSLDKVTFYFNVYIYIYINHD